MTDTNFECNILNICKGYFFEPEEGLRWLNKFEEFVLMRMVNLMKVSY